MGLNHTLGEFVPELGKLYRILPLKRWQGSPFWDDACEHAARVFAEKGASRPIQLFEENILLQAYPLTSKLVFFFCLPINGRDHYATYTFDLAPAAVGELIRLRMWEDFKPIEGTVH